MKDTTLGTKTPDAERLDEEFSNKIEPIRGEVKILRKTQETRGGHHHHHVAVESTIATRFTG